MNQHLTAKSVFFVRDTPSALAFYKDVLGFSLDWSHEVLGRPFVVQVKFLGLELILNQVEPDTVDRPGTGRIFLGISEAQSAALLHHVRSRGISIGHLHWGGPTIVMTDLDGNELFVWVPESEHPKWRDAGWVPT